MSEIAYFFALAVIPIVGIAVFIFIVGQSAFNAAYSGMKQKIIIFKFLAAWAIWCAVSYAIFYIIVESLIPVHDYYSETPPGTLEKRHGLGTHK